MLQNNSSQQIMLKVTNYTINFPSGYKFILHVPQQITIRQITQIMKSYKALHHENGKKQQDKNFQPMVLSSADGNLMSDLCLIEPSFSEYELALIYNTQFKIQYVYQVNQNGVDHLIHQFGKNYQFIGKFHKIQNLLGKQCYSDNFQYVVRSHRDCKLYLIHKFPKSSLNFSKLQGILAMRDYFTKTSLSTQPNLQHLISTFETKTSLCLVTPLYPFKLARISIQNKYLLDIILNQISKIIHMLQRDKISIKNINVDDFFIDFKLQVLYGGIYGGEREDGKEEGGNLFGKKMAGILDGLLGNYCGKSKEQYNSLLKCLKENKITNYLQFIKYYSMPQILLSSSYQQIKKKDILKYMIKNYKFPELIQLSPEQQQQFQQNYEPRTNIFTMSTQTKKTVQNNENINQRPQQQKSKKIIQQIMQNISTIKKKKNQGFNLVQPIYLNKQFYKKSKNNKYKNKFHHHLNQSHHGYHCNKKNCRKIQEFLIDD